MKSISPKDLVTDDDSKRRLLLRN